MKATLFFLLISFSLTSQVKVETIKDALTGEESKTTELWLYFGIDKRKSKLSGSVYSSKDLLMFALTLNGGGVGCISKYETKAMVKLDNDEVVELTYIGDTDCGNSFTGIFLPLTRDEMKVKGYKELAKERNELLGSHKWTLIRLYGSDGYTDIYPAKNKKKKVHDDFFKEHISAITKD